MVLYMLGLYIYHPPTRKYKRVARSGQVYYLYRLALKKYTGQLWSIRPISGD